MSHWIICCYCFGHHFMHNYDRQITILCLDALGKGSRCCMQWEGLLPMMADVLHPLAALHWEECCRLPDHHLACNCALVGDQLFVESYGRYDASRPTAHHLLALSSDLTSWNTLATPLEWFATASYHSQLVLVGGREAATQTISGQLWGTNDAGRSWRPLSVPPMPTKRHSVTVVNTGSPESLVVAGGMGAQHDLRYEVEVLNNSQWFTVQPLPFPSPTTLKCTIHNHCLHFMEVYPDVPSFVDGVYCKLESLFAYCTSSTDAVPNSPDLWKEQYTRDDVIDMASFGQQLITFAYPREINAFSQLTQCWFHVGDSPFPMYPNSMTCTTLPTGELAVMNSNGTIGTLSIAKLIRKCIS